MMSSGSITSSAVTPSFVRHSSGDEHLRDHRQRLHDEIDAREHLRALLRILEHVLHQPQLLEVQDGVRRRS